jgi:PAS domain S-box-containing protein
MHRLVQFTAAKEGWMCERTGGNTMEDSGTVDKTSVIQVLWTSDGSELASESQSLWQRLTEQTQEGGMHPWGWLAAVHPDEHEHLKAQWKEAVSSTRMFRSWYRLRSGDENDHGISLLCVPLLKDAETLDGWVSWVSREREPTSLVEPDMPSALLMFDSIAGQAPLGMFYLSLDQYFVQVNERFCQIAGYPQQELIGRRLHSILPADLQTMVNLNVRHMLTGKLQHAVYETPQPRPDGRILWLKVTSTLVWHAQGFPQYFLSWVEDLTLQRRLEQEQRVLLAHEQAAQAAAQQAQQETSALSNMLQAVFVTWSMG